MTKPYIIHLEDDLSVARAIGRVLHDSGYPAISCLRAAAAIDAINYAMATATLQDAPKVLLSDWDLGHETSERAVRAALANGWRVVLLTGSDQRQLPADLQTLDFVPKSDLGNLIAALVR